MRVFKNISVALIVLLFISCAHYSKREGENFISFLHHADPAIASLMDDSIAYVVYPEVVKGGLGVGVAKGKGHVYEKGLLGYNLVGLSELTQVTAGLQAGAQTYSEAIFFENEEAFARFKSGELSLSSNASAAFFEHGKKVNLAYDNGVAVIIQKIDGLMGELSIGGQKLSFQPL